MNYGFGYREDPPDPRDLNIKDLLSSLPKVGEATEINWEEHLPPAFDQLNTSSCVANGWSGAIKSAWNRDGHHVLEQPSRAAIYALARTTHDDEIEDTGTYIRAAAKAMRHYGFCPSSKWPFKVSKINVVPSWKALRAAYDQRWITGYYRLYSLGAARIEELKQALRQGFFPVFGTAVAQNFLDYQGGEDIIQLPTGGWLGGHAMFLYGFYRDDFFLGQNSWGPYWGNSGRYRISLEYLASVRTRDLWVVKTAPVYSKAA